MSTISYFQNKELNANVEALINTPLPFNINISDRFEYKQLMNKDALVDYKKNNFDVIVIDTPFNLNPLSLA